MWRKPLLLAASFAALSKPIQAAEVGWELYRDNINNSCSLRSEQKGYTIDFNFLPKDFGQNSIRVHSEEWKFTDSESYLIKTILRYSNGDQIPKEIEFEAIYDENYLQTYDQLLQLNVLSVQAETGIKIDEFILDFKGQDDIKFSLAPMYDLFPGYGNCVKEARDIQAEIKGDMQEEAKGEDVPIGSQNPEMTGSTDAIRSILEGN